LSSIGASAGVWSSTGLKRHDSAESMATSTSLKQAKMLGSIILYPVNNKLRAYRIWLAIKLLNI
jgi:hypothetical protein